jgi:integrase
MYPVYPQRRNGVVIGYAVDLGRNILGKRERKFFKDEDEAKLFASKNHSQPLDDKQLIQHRTELLYNLNRVQAVNATITQAVDFFLQHQPRDHTKLLGYVIDEWLEQKRKLKRKERYVLSAADVLSRFSAYVGEHTKIVDVSQKNIDDWVFKKNNWSPVTINNILTQLSVLFNWSVEKGYLVENPVEKVERPIAEQKRPALVSPDDFSKLLQRCYKKKWHDRLTIFVLVGFCGVRVEEAVKLSWSNINLEDRVVEVPSSIAKKARFRMNELPANAVSWLQAIKDERKTGLIMKSNWKNLLRSAIRFAHISYKQNALRHSFCSYAIAADWRIDKVVAMMGHTDKPDVIHAHYKDVTSKKTAERWWAISA